MKRRRSPPLLTARISTEPVMRLVMVSDEVSFVGAFVRVDRVRVLRLSDRRVLAAVITRVAPEHADRRVGSLPDRGVDPRALRFRLRARLGAARVHSRRLLPQRLP